MWKLKMNAFDSMKDNSLFPWEDKWYRKNPGY